MFVFYLFRDRTMSTNQIRKKKLSTVRFNYVQGVTKSGTVKFNKVDVPVLPDPTTSLAINETLPEVAPNHVASASSVHNLFQSDADEAAPDVLYHQDNSDNCESTDSDFEDTMDENPNPSRFTRKKKK